MSFTLAGPWAFGGKVTSSQLNALDIDHVNALDKSIAGDTLVGQITLSAATAIINVLGSGSIVSNTSGGIVAGVASAIVAAATGSIQSIAANGIEGGVTHGIGPGVAAGIWDGGIAGGIVATIANGIKSTVLHGIGAGIAGGIYDGGFVGGIVPTVAGGINDGGIASGITSTVFGGITSTATGGIRPTVAGGINDGGTTGGITATVGAGIKTLTNGGIQLAGSATDEISYATAHLSVRRNLMWSAKPGTGWTQQDQQLVGPNTTVQTNVLLTVLNDLAGSLNGATLTGVTIRYTVTDPHAGGLPAVMPQFGLQRAVVNTGSTYSLQSLTSFTPQIPAPANGAAWYASGHIQQYDFVPDQNAVLNPAQYLYYLTLEDENGANSVAGNLWLSVTLTIGSIFSTAR
jgi:hypothetical protein